MIRLSGFADEAADDLAGQIEVTKELGWSWIEARSVGGRNIHDLGEAEFEATVETLGSSGVGINCFGSTIANWGTQVDGDFAAELETVDRAITRMKRLGVPMIRIMSYAIRLDGDGRLSGNLDKPGRVARLKEICGRFTAAGIVPVHENCLNYGGISWRHTLELLEEVPGLKLVFDTGNPCLTPDFTAAYPYPNQDAMIAWKHLKRHVAHIHIKDGWRDPATNEEHYLYPGEGPCQVEAILEDCIRDGYDGWLTIEPHMAAVFHDASVQSPAQRRKDVYLEYGRRVETMLKGLGLEVSGGTAEQKERPRKEH